MLKVSVEETMLKYHRPYDFIQKFQLKLRAIIDIRFASAIFRSSCI